MKNISLILNAVLIVAVGILYYFHFSSSKTSTPVMTMPLAVKGATNIVYVNVDTLLHNYDYYKKVKQDFENKRNKVEDEITKQGKELETEYKAAQQKAQMGQMTEAQMKEAEQKLMQKQQEIMAYKESQEQSILKQNQEMTEGLFKKIHEYLQKINKDYNYQFVMGYTKDGGILLANDSLDITKYVVDGLNKEEKK